ncbi:unnamed protein product, partial [Allacma fusca]
MTPRVLSREKKSITPSVYSKRLTTSGRKSPTRSISTSPPPSVRSIGKNSTPGSDARASVSKDAPRSPSVDEISIHAPADPEINEILGARDVP